MDKTPEPADAAVLGTRTTPGLTLQQKAGLCTGADYWRTQAAPEIGLPSVRLADGPHGLRLQDDANPDHLGVGRSIPATCFPPAVTLASSWDLALIECVGTALAREARAQGVQVILGPGLNIKPMNCASCGLPTSAISIDGDPPWHNAWPC